MSEFEHDSITESIISDRGYIIFDSHKRELILEPIYKVKNQKNNEDGLQNTKRKIRQFEQEIKLAELNTTQRGTSRRTLMEIMHEEGVEDERGDVIEDAGKTKFYFRKMQMVEGGAFVFSLISILVSVIEIDMRFQNYSQVYTNTLLAVISISTIFLILLTYLRYLIELKLMKEQNLYSRRDDLVTSGRIYSLLFELFIIVPHPNLAFRGIIIHSQDLYDSIDVTYELNDFLHIWILMRTFILFRVLLNVTDYASTRATRICRMYGCAPGYLYAIKCLMNKTPLTTVTILFLVSILLGGQAIKICEQPLHVLQPLDSKDFSKYLNCFWCMIITMTTVGYGDYFARTIPGRFITVIACIVGVFLVSIMVVALTNTLNMNSSEAKAHNVINRLSVRSELMDHAANLLTSAFRFSLDNKKGIITQGEIKPRLRQIKQHADNFRTSNRSLKSMFDNSNLSEEMSRHFDNLKDDLHEIYDNQVMLRDYLLKLKKHTANEGIEEPHTKFNLRI